MINYEQAMAFLESTKKYGSQLGLTSIVNLMHELNDVQESIPVVHIAGTNGKGSVGAMLSAVLTECGYKTARFNTPDVFSYEEEFLMDGRPISKTELAEVFTVVAAACERLVQNGMPHPTRFEVETAAAFVWFAGSGCDIALVEVGMGGETDATNLISRPLVSVLTSISMDHMNYLGDTLAEIAAVKSGIIKQDCPVVSMLQEPEVAEVIEKKCRQMHAPLFWSTSVVIENVKCEGGALSFTWRPESGPVPVQPGLRELCQIENAACAIRVLELLAPQYPRISVLSIKCGLEKVRWPGRFEKICSSPDVYLDGAHNEDAVRKLRATLDQNFPGKKILFIMGVLADKEYDKMIQIMFRPGDRVFTVTPPNPRALRAEALAELLCTQNIRAISCENPKDAVSYALYEAGTEDIILVFGSLYYLKEIRKAFEEKLSEQRDGIYQPAAEK